MKPGACISSSIELLDIINDAWGSGSRQPADSILAQYYRSRRYIGSKDRAAISALVYFTLRNGSALEWLLEQAAHKPSSRALIILSLIFMHEADLNEFSDWLSDSDKYSAKPLTDAEKKLVTKYSGTGIIHADMPDSAKYNYPQWMEKRLQQAFGDELPQAMDRLNEEAEVHLRTNSLKTTRSNLLEELNAEGLDAKASETHPLCIRLAKRGPVFSTDAFKNGWFEMQDEGSQLLADLVQAKPGDKVIDFCAGAGGKTLAIAAKMKNKGRILAWDNTESRLKQMPKRLARAGVDNVMRQLIKSETDPFIKRHKNSADWVLTDAPCSGSGTWRRSPDLKWRTTPKDIEEIKQIQANILRSAARLPKPNGGYLVYATCSIFAEENEQQIEKFLDDHPEFELVPASELAGELPPAIASSNTPYLRLMPHIHDTDGFFAAVMRRK